MKGLTRQGVRDLDTHTSRGLPRNSMSDREAMQAFTDGCSGGGDYLRLIAHLWSALAGVPAEQVKFSDGSTLMSHAHDLDGCGDNFTFSGGR